MDVLMMLMKPMFYSRGSIKVLLLNGCPAHHYGCPLDKTVNISKQSKPVFDKGVTYGLK